MSKFFALTVSPRYRSIKPETLYEQDKYSLRRLLNRMSTHYILYPEFDKNSRLHYHGVVECHDLIKFHRIKYLFDNIGWTKLDPLKTFMDRLRFIIYCQKEFAVTHQLLDPIMYKSLRKVRQMANHNLDDNPGITRYLTIIERGGLGGEAPEE